METTAVSKAWRLDSMGNRHGYSGDDLIGDYCVCFASEREGRIASYVDGFSSLILFFSQREDELERRRVSHHINFDAL